MQVVELLNFAYSIVGEQHQAPMQAFLAAKFWRIRMELDIDSTLSGRSRRMLSSQEVHIVEAEIDTYLNKIQLPDVEQGMARRLTCLVYDDLNRQLVDRAADELKKQKFRLVMTDLMVRLDALKYAFREALRIVSKNGVVSAKDGELKNPENTFFYSIVEIAMQYRRATSIFYGYHNEDIRLEIDDRGIIYTTENEIDLRFQSLEALVHVGAPRENTFDFFVFCFLEDNSQLADGTTVSWSEAYKSVVSRSRERKGKIKYNLITQLALPLFNTFRRGNALVIDDWICPWGSMKQTADFFAALATISLYHIISIHQRAEIAKMEGGGFDQICYLTKPNRLVEDVSRISGLVSTEVERLVEAFTYGHQTRTPDPVLQPLLGVDGGRLAIPGAMLLSSNWPRNVLSLHARVAPATFDAQSKVFEGKMVSGLRDSLGLEFEIASNVFFLTSEGKEEVDLVIMQKEKKVALLCELRWMLQPGDQSEVYNRIRAIRKKVSQIDRKYERIKRSSPFKEMTYLPIVIIDGYGGALSPIPTKIPIVNVHVFTKIAKLNNGLEFLHAFLCTPDWLPKAGRDFEVHREAEELCGKIFSQTGIRPIGDNYLNESLPKYLLEASHRTLDEIKSVRWPS